ncbi:DUF998 domain-containing protein [Streptomyces olivochromogenes]|nr:DUF998 domain-containing protein [Streptomyces olivochromogenes]
MIAWCLRADRPCSLAATPPLFLSTGQSSFYLLAGGIAAGPLFLGAGLVQGLTRDGFDFTRNAISQLSLGSLGWIQVTVFLLTGALAIAGAVGIRQVFRGAPGGTWAPRLIGVFGASFLLAAVFAADPGAGFPAGAPRAPATTALSSRSCREVTSSSL